MLVTVIHVNIDMNRVAIPCLLYHGKKFGLFRFEGRNMEQLLDRLGISLVVVMTVVEV